MDTNNAPDRYLPYLQPPVRILTRDGQSIASFLDGRETNLDPLVVESFGSEWSKFSAFSTDEVKKIGDDYFDLLPGQMEGWLALDVGCGSGRWADYLLDKVGVIEAIDPSAAVWVAQRKLAASGKARVTHASVDYIPFSDNSFDLVYSLGVLHHLPDTQKAIHTCYAKVKSQGYFLIYLYYNLENRSAIHRFLFRLSNYIRLIVSRLPDRLKKAICDLIAALVYFPLALVSRLAAQWSPKFVDMLPLSYYRKTSFFVMRNDALDRFGTTLEKRFSKSEIIGMLRQAGFINIVFSDRQPYWHALAQKP